METTLDAEAGLYSSKVGIQKPKLGGIADLRFKISDSADIFWNLKSEICSLNYI